MKRPHDKEISGVHDHLLGSVHLQAPHLQLIDFKERSTRQQTHRFHAMFVHAHAVTILQLTRTTIQATVDRQITITEEDTIGLHKHGAGIGRRQVRIAENMSRMERNLDIQRQRKQKARRIARPSARWQRWMT